MRRFKIAPSISTRASVIVISIAFIGIATKAQVQTSQAAAPAFTLPIWAYPVAPPPPANNATAPTATQTDAIRHATNSDVGLTTKQTKDLFSVPDWFPNSHPAMPSIVSQGRKPDIGACGYCHLPNGLGRPENQSIAGLPEAYILEQLQDFKTGLRHSSEPRMPSVNNMIRAAKAATPEEMKAGAEYFASLKPKRWIRVVESNTVPKSRIAGGMLVLAEPASTEPIGERVIELPEDLEQTELRNSTSGFVAYVPVGSLARGESLVKTGGNGKTIPCTACHGPNLKGTGNVPSIAGRSPSQMTRQIIDFQNGTRNGAGAALMKAPVAHLTNADIVAITGYLASLEP